jgi:hypothetical protein
MTCKAIPFFVVASLSWGYSISCGAVLQGLATDIRHAVLNTSAHVQQALSGMVFLSSALSRAKDSTWWNRLQSSLSPASSSPTDYLKFDRGTAQLNYNGALMAIAASSALLKLKNLCSSDPSSPNSLSVSGGAGNLSACATYLSDNDEDITLRHLLTNTSLVSSWFLSKYLPCYSMCIANENLCLAEVPSIGSSGFPETPTFSVFQAVWNATEGISSFHRKASLTWNATSLRMIEGTCQGLSNLLGGAYLICVVGFFVVYVNRFCMVRWVYSTSF